MAEQKKLMMQIYEEKRKIAEDRAQLDSDIAAYKDRIHKDSLSNINIEAELTVGRKRMAEDKARLEKLVAELRDKEAQLKQERLMLEEEKRDFDMKSAKLEQLAIEVNKRLLQSEEKLSVFIYNLNKISILKQDSLKKI